MSNRYFNLLQIVIVVFLLLISLWIFPDINTDENSRLEFLQAIVIGVTMLIYGYSTIKESNLSAKIGSIGFALLMFSFLLRELDVEEFALPEMMRYLLGKEGKNFTMFLLWGSYLVAYTSYVKNKIEKVKLYIISFEGMLWICALLLLILSQLMDKNIFHMKYPINRYYEEFLELFSYLYILLSSWVRIEKKN